MFVKMMKEIPGLGECYNGDEVSVRVGQFPQSCSDAVAAKLKETWPEYFELITDEEIEKQLKAIAEKKAKEAAEVEVKLTVETKKAVVEEKKAAKIKSEVVEKKDK